MNEFKKKPTEDNTTYYDRKRKLEDEHRANCMKKGREIARLFGAATKAGDRDGSISIVFTTGPDAGLSFYLRPDEDRITVNGHYRYKTEHGFDVYGPDHKRIPYVEITVSAKKNAATIAEDIKRRFLPDHRVRWAAVKAGVDKHLAHQADHSATVMHIAKISKTETPMDGRTEFYFNFGEDDDSAKIRVNGPNSVDISFTSLPAHIAEQIITFAKGVK